MSQETCLVCVKNILSVGGNSTEATSIVSGAINAALEDFLRELFTLFIEKYSL